MKAYPRGFFLLGLSHPWEWWEWKENCCGMLGKMISTSLSANFAVGLLKLEETRACSERHTRALLQKGNLSKSETYEKSSRIAKIAFHGFSMWLVKGKSKWYVELKSDDRKYCIGFSATTTTTISLFQAKKI